MMQAEFEISATATGGIDIAVRWHGCTSDLFLPAHMVSWDEVYEWHHTLFDFSRLQVERFEVVEG